MKLIFLGSGSAFTVGDNFHSNMLIQSDSGKNFLIDCGTDLRFSLHALGFSYQDITDVYISHLHADHCGGLEWLGLTRKFDSACSKPRLYLHSLLAGPLWETRLKGGMETLSDEVASLESYFEVNSFENEFEWERLRFCSIKTLHVRNGASIIPSFGLEFKLGAKRILITTDTQFNPSGLTESYRKADLIFHDCETSTRHSGVHAHYDQLQTLEPAIKQKMWLYHYNQGDLPDANADGFLGFVKRGQVFEF